MERILSPADVPRVGGELCRDGGPDRRGDFSGSQLPGKEGAEVDAPGGGPLSRASVRLDDRADGCGVPGAGAAAGAGVEKRALYRSNPQTGEGGLNLLGYEILHLGRVLMEQAMRRGWSLRRFRSGCYEWRVGRCIRGDD